MLVYFLTAHWSKPIDFSDETLAAAAARVDGFREVFRGSSEPAPPGEWERFEAALEDDFNTPDALAVMHGWRDHDLLLTPATAQLIKDKVASRIKVISKLDISEKRVPQDGRIKIKTLGREVEETGFEWLGVAELSSLDKVGLAISIGAIGGIGINLAIQDAVATANILAGPLSRRNLRICSVSTT